MFMSEKDCSGKLLSETDCSCDASAWRHPQRSSSVPEPRVANA
eukprot:CAMPEP_0172664704 /NCGR_PEP_ID=MMETSP1074-20121228/6777_1 /TAXON_ID=2916 /ORGANISM="Ceratium fusus, Strain PA161109" /LENGTH=42 /DNA_ID= /DNA_START= /DNA_END= /DNA_ORIENTATION=